MRHVTRRVPAVCVVSLVVLLPHAVAVADVDITYAGETTDMTTYSGSNADDDAWDYVYDMSVDGGWSMFYGPFHWGIYVPYEVADSRIYDPSGWSGSWDASIDDAEYGGYFDGTPLDSRPGIVWSWTSGTPSLTGFHYQANTAPFHGDWVACGDDSGHRGDGEEWTAAPEPATLLLTSVGLFGLSLWRRRTTV